MGGVVEIITGRERRRRWSVADKLRIIAEAQEVGARVCDVAARHDDPFNGQLFVFRGRRGDLIKILAWHNMGLCLFGKRLDRGRFVWPQAKEGSVSLTPAQLSMLLEGIDWRMLVRTWHPEMAG